MSRENTQPYTTTTAEALKEDTRASTKIWDYLNATAERLDQQYQPPRSPPTDACKERHIVGIARLVEIMLPYALRTQSMTTTSATNAPATEIVCELAPVDEAVLAK